jgi:hypothetical protein
MKRMDRKLIFPVVETTKAVGFVAKSTAKQLVKMIFEVYKLLWKLMISMYKWAGSTAYELIHWDSRKTRKA